MEINTNQNRQPADAKKYILTFVITAVIFGTMLYINNRLDQARIGDVKGVQDQISLDLLSSETQFNLLSEASCKSVTGPSVLSQELNSLATKLSYLEANDQGKPSDELVYLKKYYSLLEIKDYLLMKRLNEKCGTSAKQISVLYFYGQKSDCPACKDMSDVLTYLRVNYPEMRIYSFDMNIDLPALKTMQSIYNIKADKLPAIVYKDDTYVGAKTIEEMKSLIPALKKIDADRKAEENKKTSSPSSVSTSTSKSTI